MKKFYVHNIDQHIVENIEKINYASLDMVPVGCADLVICDCLDSLVLDERNKVFNDLFTKICVGGKLVLRLLNLKIFAKFIGNDVLNLSQANEILANCRSMLDDVALSQALEQKPNFVMIENTYDGINRLVILQRTV